MWVERKAGWVCGVDGRGWGLGFRGWGLGFGIGNYNWSLGVLGVEVRSGQG